MDVGGAASENDPPLDPSGRRCLNCGTPAVLNATYCDHCGSLIPEQKPKWYLLFRSGGAALPHQSRLLTGSPVLDSCFGWFFVAAILLSPSFRAHHLVFGTETLTLAIVPFVFLLITQRAAPALARGVASALTAYAICWVALFAWTAIQVVSHVTPSVSHYGQSIQEFFRDPIKKWREP